MTFNIEFSQSAIKEFNDPLHITNQDSLIANMRNGDKPSVCRCGIGKHPRSFSTRSSFTELVHVMSEAIQEEIDNEIIAMIIGTVKTDTISNETKP